MRTRIGILCLLIGGLSACGDSHEQNALKDARVQWRAAGPAAYEWVVQRTCFCPDIEPVRVQVRDAAVVSAARQMDATTEVALTVDAYQAWFTVDGLFDEVRRAIDEGADELTVTYDPEYGYPRSVAIDRYENAMDDETGFNARGLVSLP
ncbi:MAG: hypothetical protein HY903_22900 [Deltaproteobacteria bacterium]|nr:hypothetical protein [Deltaproteobacteria bacterium]